MEADTIAIIGSWLTIMIAILWQSNRHEDSIKALDRKFTDKLDALDTKFTDKHDATESKLATLDPKLATLDTKLTALDTKVEELSESSRERGRVLGDVRERLARVEGHLMRPGDFTVHRRSPAAKDPALGAPSPDPPADDHREAG